MRFNKLPQFSGLMQHPYIISQFLWIRSWAWVYCVFCKAAVKYRPGVSSSGDSAGESLVLWLLAAFSSLLLEDSWKPASVQSQREREKERERERSIYSSRFVYCYKNIISLLVFLIHVSHLVF